MLFQVHTYIHTVPDAGFIQGGGGCKSAHMKILEAMSVFDWNHAHAFSIV